MSKLCPDCKNPVEILKACGCRDYFCNHCNQMVSKSRVIDSEQDVADAVKDKIMEEASKSS